MFTSRNERRCPGATRGRFAPLLARFSVLVSVLAAVIMLSAPHAAAQPAPEQAMRAYRTLDEWVRAWQIPGDAAKAPVEGARGACVTLRYGGRLVGRGIALATVSDGQLDPTLLVRAAGDAMRDAEPHLPVPNDALREQGLRRLASEIAIGLELSGQMIPIEPRTWEEAELGLAPGLDGVSAKLLAPSSDGASHPERAVFPSMMTITGTPVHRALSGAIAQAIGKGGAAAALDEPEKIRQQHGVRMSRFRVTHLAQPWHTKEPVFVHRGGALIGAGRSLSLADIADMRDRLTRHLIVRLRESDPELSLTQAALALWAVASVRAGSPAPELAGEIDQALATIPGRREFLIRPGESAGDRLTAGLLLAGLRFDHDAGNQAWATWSELLPPLAGAVRDRCLAGPAPVLALRGMCLLRVPGSPWSGSGEPAADAAGELLRAALAQTPVETRASLLPWLAIAATDQRLGAATPRADFGVVLREIREQAWSHQLGVVDAGADRTDMIGGIAFTLGARTRASALADWQTARLVAGFAAMLRDPRLTEPTERSREIVRLLGAIRFLRQLQVDESALWMYQEPARVLGGIRAAPWERDLPIDASSITLLACVEVIRTLDELSKAPRSTPRSE